ncbi:MAG: polyribonucleotide nucleotidyltransferase [Candidatus Omnitrophica bacterium]|nr:polyribonucleotide nucleotidyltransferase [Candidatus Omnitrophota bacterium]
MKKQTKIRNEDFIIETGRLAKQAAGAVTVQCGGTVVLVTVTWSDKAKENCDFLPLTVDYRERTYAAGKIPGGFFKREGRPTEKEILSSRLIDRAIRTLFPKNFNYEVQVIATVLSADGKNEPDWLAINGASAALLLSDIPLNKAVGAIRIGRSRGRRFGPLNNPDQVGIPTSRDLTRFIINPSYSELEKSDLNLVVAGTEEDLLMLEGEAKEIDEFAFLEGIRTAQEAIKRLVILQKEIARECEKRREREISLKEISASPFYLKLEQIAAKEIEEIIQLKDREERKEKFALLAERVKEEVLQGDYFGFCEEEIVREVGLILDDLKRKEFRRLITEKQKRQDGRGFKEIRPLKCEVGVLPCTHGSALFTRGQTQSLTVVTLGTKMDEQIVEALEGKSRKRFMLHYNFPSFSVGEVRPLRGPGRREIGHGALAERALSSVLPSEEEFPYTVRVVSDILESNGSSSMATVCAGSLALMDAGVPIKSAVAGIALGLVKEGERMVLLTDIAGDEDHYGDMDLKIAGTSKGITAVQMDLKIEGLSLDILSAAFDQSRKARIEILNKMAATISRPRAELSPYAPRITIIQINPSKIGNVIGPSGKTIKEIIRKTGVEIDVDDEGKVMVASPDKSASEEAIAMIKRLSEELEVGKVYSAKVKKITNFGAFCEILPGEDGFIHISELSNGYVEKVEDVLKLGDKVKVKVIKIDEQGRVSLSKKQAERK